MLIADSIGLFDLNGWLIRQDTDARIIKLENLSPDFIFNPVAPGSDVVSSDSTAPVKGLAYETILEMIDTC